MISNRFTAKQEAYDQRVKALNQLNQAKRMTQLKVETRS